MKLFGIDLINDINWKLLGYVVFSILFLVYGTKEIYSIRRTSGIIFGIGCFLVLLHFGLRWFGRQKQTSTNWPPSINTCPDYLTYNSTISGCVDFLGVTTGSGTEAIQKIKKSDYGASGTITSTTQLPKVFKKTSADVTAATTDQALLDICDLCQRAGVTWEGVWDGDTCTAIKLQKTREQKCLLTV
jgi:uncharacterized membrane protein YuzA (DUF378 family)